MTKKVLKGIVTSAKNNKTIVVEVTRKFKHPFYEKVIVNLFQKRKPGRYWKNDSNSNRINSC